MRALVIVSRGIAFLEPSSVGWKATSEACGCRHYLELLCSEPSARHISFNMFIEYYSHQTTSPLPSFPRLSRQIRTVQVPAACLRWFWAGLDCRLHVSATLQPLRTWPPRDLSHCLIGRDFLSLVRMEKGTPKDRSGEVVAQAASQDCACRIDSQPILNEQSLARPNQKISTPLSLLPFSCSLKCNFTKVQ